MKRSSSFLSYDQCQETQMIQGPTRSRFGKFPKPNMNSDKNPGNSLSGIPRAVERRLVKRSAAEGLILESDESSS